MRPRLSFPGGLGFLGSRVSLLPDLSLGNGAGVKEPGLEHTGAPQVFPGLLSVHEATALPPADQGRDPGSQQACSFEHFLNASRRNKFWLQPGKKKTEGERGERKGGERKGREIAGCSQNTQARMHAELRNAQSQALPKDGSVSGTQLPLLGFSATSLWVQCYSAE